MSTPLLDTEISINSTVEEIYRLVGSRKTVSKPNKTGIYTVRFSRMGILRTLRETTQTKIVNLQRQKVKIRERFEELINKIDKDIIIERDNNIKIIEKIEEESRKNPKPENDEK